MENKELKFIRILLTLIVLVIGTIILKELKTIIMPLAIAILLSFIFVPFLKFLERKLPTGIAILLTLIIIIVSLVLVGTIFYTGAESFIEQFPKYEQKLSKMFTETIVKYEIPLPEVKEYIKNELQLVNILDKISVSDVLSRTLGSFVDFLFKMFLTVVYLFFILLERKQFKERMTKLKGIDWQQKFKLNIINQKIRTFLIYKTFISFLTAITGIIVLWIFKVDFIIIAGFLLFFLNFIPNIGSISASVFPVLVYFLDYGFTSNLVILMILMFLIQLIYGNIIEPRMMGKTLRVSPIIIMISFIFWAWLWGVMGMMLSVPITSVTVYILKQFETSRPLAQLISDED